MANCDNLFKEFNENLKITSSKRERLMTSRDNIHDKIIAKFKEDHSEYIPQFYIQGSYKMNTMIRTKDDTCDLDYGVYFESNPDDVTGTTLQNWIKDAVTGITGSTPIHKKKCITVDYAADYNIDLPVLWYDDEENEHPKLAVKDGDWQDDDPREFVDHFNSLKDDKGQLVRMVNYLKAWCDNKRNKMPSGLSMTVLAMNHFQSNDRDDLALKFLLIEIENELNREFKCAVPTTPQDDLFEEYNSTRRQNLMDNLSDFIADAKQAIDERNQLKASKLWQKHIGKAWFPDGQNEDEEEVNSALLTGVIGSAIPYYDFR